MINNNNTMALPPEEFKLVMPLLRSLKRFIEDKNFFRFRQLMDSLSHEEKKRIAQLKFTDGQTCLIAACRSNCLDIVEFLVEECQTDIEQVASVKFDGEQVEGVPPLWCCAAAGHLTIVQYLISRGALLNRTTITNSTALRAACFDGHYDVVEYLVGQGANIEIPNRHGHTCLMISCYRLRHDIVQFLIRQGARINRQSAKGNTALHDCAESGNLESMKLLLECGAIQRPDEYGLTPIMAGANAGYDQIVDYLARNYAHVIPAEELAMSYELLGACLYDRHHELNEVMANWRSALEHYSRTPEQRKIVVTPPGLPNIDEQVAQPLQPAHGDSDDDDHDNANDDNNAKNSLSGDISAADVADVAASVSLIGPKGDQPSSLSPKLSRESKLTSGGGDDSLEIESKETHKDKQKVEETTADKKRMLEMSQTKNKFNYCTRNYWKLQMKYSDMSSELGHFLICGNSTVSASDATTTAFSQPSSQLSSAQLNQDDRFKQIAVKAFRETREFCSAEALDALDSDSNTFKLQSILIRLRVLGPDHPDTIYYIRYRGAIYADAGDFERCLALWLYALELQKAYLEPLCHVVQAAFVSFAELFIYILKDGYSVLPAEGLDPALIISVMELCVDTIERGLEFSYYNWRNRHSWSYTAADKEATNLMKQTSLCLHFMALILNTYYPVNCISLANRAALNTNSRSTNNRSADQTANQRTVDQSAGVQQRVQHKRHVHWLMTGVWLTTEQLDAHQYSHYRNTAVSTSAAAATSSSSSSSSSALPAQHFLPMRSADSANNNGVIDHVECEDEPYFPEYLNELFDASGGGAAGANAAMAAAAVTTTSGFSNVANTTGLGVAVPASSLPSGGRIKARLAHKFSRELESRFHAQVRRLVRLDPRLFNGITALHLACSLDVENVGRLPLCPMPNVNVVRLLLHLGASPNQPDATGVLPLELVVSHLNATQHHPHMMSAAAAGAATGGGGGAAGGAGVGGVYGGGPNSNVIQLEPKKTRVFRQVLRTLVGGSGAGNEAGNVAGSVEAVRRTLDCCHIDARFSQGDLFSPKILKVFRNASVAPIGHMRLSCWCARVLMRFPTEVLQELVREMPFDVLQDFLYH